MSTIPYILDASAALRFSRARRFDKISANELSRLAVKALLPKRLVRKEAERERGELG